ncbi:primosomal protein N' [Nocardioides acrostichi]|uniref:Probable replication restart protein PriA n=1 Tax=Nocardioides acrostichi TaxID=2784339 RepID=A0A930V1Y5_9ACTN|nr:primosomal protein N' [Nocardioides acrostichi]MBF4163180.1 primosomal protein N' [Nocardioides acrostichi]
MTTPPPQPPEQPELLPGMVRAGVKQAQAKARATRERKAAGAAITDVDPVARVLVDTGLAHLDRPFDFAVPASMSEAARPGVRVKVRFAGKEADGYLLERAATSDHTGRLQPLRRVVGAEQVLTGEVADLAALVAGRYAGTRHDVLRLAVPPRHATTEKAEDEPTTAAVVRAPSHPEWAHYPHAAAWLARLGSGEAPRAVWNASPGADWPRLLADAALAAPGGVVLCLPDGKDVARVAAALDEASPEAPQHAVLTADLGPAARYRSFLRLLRGQRRIAVGTRAAALAPVRDLSLVMIWDDGDDLHAEPRAPYPHTRETLLLRAEQVGCAAMVAGFARTVEAQHLVHTGWAHEIAVARQPLRAAVTVRVTGASDHDLARDVSGRGARIPREVHDLLRHAVQQGPVLVQNPRQGYLAALACERCRTPARCPACTGPLRLGTPTRAASCAWCGTEAPGWACAECGHRGLRAPVLGQARTAEELGRSLPGVSVRTSARDDVLASVPDKPVVVVATPGAEPVAEAGYAAVVVLDTWLGLGRPELRGEEEALRRWANAIGLVRPGGRALLVGDPGHPTLQALVRWDVAGFAAREAENRASAHLPPASRMATITGLPGAVDDALTLLAAPEDAELLGPVPDERDAERSRLVVRVPRRDGPALSAALGELQRVRSARKLDPVRVQVDPMSL